MTALFSFMREEAFGGGGGGGLIRRVLVTDGDGAQGRSLVRALAALHDFEVVSLDLHEVPTERRAQGVRYRTLNLDDHALLDTLREHAIDTVVHLASNAVNVAATRNLAEACIAAGVRQLVVASSGAVYGYHANNPEWLVESDALRGNAALADACHMRQVEELLAGFRRSAPQLQQTVLRIGSVLGAAVNHPVTALFDKPALIAVRGSASRFAFIWDEDVTAIIVRAVTTRRAGVFNVAGDGAVSLREIAALLGKPVRELPAVLLRAALAVGRALRLSRHGAEQVDLLRYRPVLDNARLKHEFGYRPAKTSREAFEAWMRARAPMSPTCRPEWASSR